MMVVDTYSDVGRWEFCSFVDSLKLKNENWLEGHCLKMMSGQLVMETDPVRMKSESALLKST